MSRDSLVYGSYRPGSNTTGVLSVKALTVFVGDFTTSKDGQIIEHLDITGRLIIRHNGVTVRNCRVQGGQPTGSWFVTVDTTQSRVAPTRFYDCTFAASVKTVGSGSGIQGRDFELHRCDISGSVDGVGAQYSNVGIFGCWIHDLPYYPYDPAHKDGSHNDCIQVHGGIGFTINGNSLEAGTKGNAAIMVTQDAALTSKLSISNNWIISTDNCATGINISQGGKPAMASVSIMNNRFSPLVMWRVGHAGLIDAPTFDASAISGNVYDVDGLPAKITRVKI
jgi:hypothetical protein